MAPSHGFAAASHREAALREAPASHGETVFRGAAGFREARRDAVHPSRNPVLRARVLEVRIHLPPAESPCLTQTRPMQVENRAFRAGVRPSVGPTRRMPTRKRTSTEITGWRSMMFSLEPILADGPRSRAA